MDTTVTIDPLSGTILLYLDKLKKLSFFKLIKYIFNSSIKLNFFLLFSDFCTVVCSSVAGKLFNSKFNTVIITSFPKKPKVRISKFNLQLVKTKHLCKTDAGEV